MHPSYGLFGCSSFGKKNCLAFAQSNIKHGQWALGSEDVVWIVVKIEKNVQNRRAKFWSFWTFYKLTVINCIESIVFLDADDSYRHKNLDTPVEKFVNSSKLCHESFESTNKRGERSIYGNRSMCVRLYSRKDRGLESLKCRDLWSIGILSVLLRRLTLNNNDFVKTNMAMIGRRLGYYVVSVWRRNGRFSKWR